MYKTKGYVSIMGDVYMKYSQDLTKCYGYDYKSQDRKSSYIDKLQNVIDKLNPDDDLYPNVKIKKLYTIKDSKIHGNGVFAIEDIPKNTNLGIGLYKYGNGDSDNDFNRFDICKYTNHSDNPNLYYKKENRKYFFYSLRDIKKGEELTIDYKKI